MLKHVGRLMNPFSNAFGPLSASFAGVLDQLSVPSAAAYSTRKLRAAYAGSAIRVRRSSDNVEADIGFATTLQYRTNTCVVQPNNDAGSSAPGVTMTTVGTGIEFGQNYIDVRWNGTATSNGFAQFTHSVGGVFNSDIHAQVPSSALYVTSLGARLVSGTLPPALGVLRGIERTSTGGLPSLSSLGGITLTSQITRYSCSKVSAATTAYIQPNFFWGLTNGLSYDFTVRFYQPNVEVGVNHNAKPLSSRNLPEVVANIGDIDVDALTSHVGSTDGFVTAWYDQSGNSRDVTQAVAANQPRIVNAGAMVTLNGRPSPVFNGVNDILTRDAAFGLYAAGAITTCAVLQAPGQLDRRIWAEGSSLSGFPIYAPIQSFNSSGGADSSAFIRNDAGGVLLVVPILTTNAFNDTPRVLTHMDTGSALSGFLDGAAGSTVAYTRSGVMTVDRFAVGGLLRNVPISHVSGLMPEVVIVASALSVADRQLLERNQGTFYGITVI